MSVPKFRIGKRIYLRAIEESDVARITVWMNDHETTRYLLTGRFAMTHADERAWLHSHSGKQDNMVFAICRNDDDQHIGNCGLHEVSWIDRCCVLGVVIGDSRERGRGYASEVVPMLLAYAFQDLNLERVELSYMAGNDRAEHVYRKLGFVEEGRLRNKRYREGRYLDEVVMSVLRKDWLERTA